MIFVSVLIISLTCVAISCFVLNYRRRQFVKTVKPLHGPNVLSFIKHGYNLLQTKHNGLYNITYSLIGDYSSPFRYWLGNKLLIAIYDPDQIKTVLQSKHCLEKDEPYKFFSPVFGEGLITAPTSIWMKKRKIFDNGFKTNMLQNYFHTFVDQSLLFTDEFEKVWLNENEVIFLKDILRCTVNIAFANLIGIKLELQSDILSRWIKTITRCREIFRHRTYNMLLYPDIIFNHTALRREQRKKRNNLNSIIDDIIQQRMDVLKLDTTKTEDTTFFDILMEATRGKEFYDDIITMLLASSDTTAIIINFVVFMLANFPEIQEKVYKELLEIYGTETPKSVPVKYEDLQRMAYLDCVIKETMRFFPIAPAIGRKITEDIKMGEYILPKGADVFILITKLHRDEKYWPNPLAFDPDRFLPKNMGNSYWKYYFPFSGGPRNCIGMKYAMISMKVILATLLRTFVFKVDESIEVDKIKFGIDIIIFSLESLKVKIKKRNAQYQ